MTWRADIVDIKKSFRDGRLIPFVGAGLSMCVHPFPSWNDLLADLRGELPGAERRHFDALDRDPLDRAEFFCRVKGKDGHKKLRTKVQSILKDGEAALLAHRTTRKTVLDCQMTLAKNFDRIYTTNYDRLLEIACRLGKYKCFPIFGADSAQKDPRETWCTQHSVSDSPAKPGKIVQIIKYHGDYADRSHKKTSSSVVVTEGDYYRRLIDLDTKDVLLMRDLIFYDVLFLGYSFRDMSLKYVFHRITRLLEEVKQGSPTMRRGRSFFVTTEHDDAKADYLYRAYGVKTWYIQEPTARKADPSAKLVFDPTLADAPQGLPDTIELANFTHLYRLAENEPLLGWPFRLRQLCHTVEDIFRLRTKGPTLRGLTKPERGLLRELVESKAFTRLRADVMYACYSSFL